MLFSWLKRRRRRKLIAQPVPESWPAILQRNLPFFATLSESEQEELCNRVKIFVAEKNWEGCRGLEITDEIRITIATQACFLVLGLKDNLFDHVRTILVYPAHYYAEARRHTGGGIVYEGFEGRLGEAWYHGPVVLSWEDVQHGCFQPHDGVNVVFHEFAHQLDMQDGLINGTPPLESREQYEQWRTVMTGEFEKLNRQSERGTATLLDHYGTTDPAEFFAVATECFFEKPLAFRRRHPRLYNLLKGYFHQDPAVRIKP
jgi:Mlc titration factor MtfA (ptsG expression regulator)